MRTSDHPIVSMPETVLTTDCIIPAAGSINIIGKIFRLTKAAL